MNTAEPTRCGEPPCSPKACSIWPECPRLLHAQGKLPSDLYGPLHHFDGEQPKRPATTFAVTSFTEWRLIKVQGEARTVCARGSREYVEGSFTEFAAYTMPDHLCERFRKPVIRWEIQSVQVTEQVLGCTEATAEQVQAAKDEMANRPHPEMLGHDGR